ncbi:MBL fold metallo-hydrolase [Larkinella rosea]|uniref:MBL fold metallo-hydrolase n=1 Tax=Larkinella rosea TaxID=2025312 RepID=A0A3P1BEC9_9BACT|nr:MBL fold metallo-hydrolase [Larkinella rosea]
MFWQPSLVFRSSLLPAVFIRINYGISPDSIKTVIISHLHEDHTGGLSSFRKARVIVH